VNSEADITQQENTTQNTDKQADTTAAAPASSALHLELDAALRRCGGKLPLLHKLLTRFTDEQADFVARCQKLLTEDHDQARRAAHTLKGTSGNLGLPVLSQAAGELENALTAQDTAAIATCLHELGNSLKCHIAQVREWLAQPVPA
jgi:HPt (histidine-containing phosphotransfer) domain-containing protein